MHHIVVAAATALLLATAPLHHAVAAEGRPVTIIMGGSAVTSTTKGYGWRGSLGVDSTAMDRAELPERERVALAEQIGVPLGQVPILKAIRLSSGHPQSRRGAVFEQ